METPVTIYYHKGKPCAVVFNGKTIWDSGVIDKEQPDENFIQIDVILPWMIAINFVITFCQGISVENLKDIMEKIRKRTTELIEIEARNLKVDTELNLNW